MGDIVYRYEVEARLRYVKWQMAKLRAEVVENALMEQQDQKDGELKAKALKNQSEDLEGRLQEIVKDIEEDYEYYRYDIGENEWKKGFKQWKRNRDGSSHGSRSQPVQYMFDLVSFDLDIKSIEINEEADEDLQEEEEEERPVFIPQYCEDDSLTIIRPYNENELLLYCGEGIFKRSKHSFLKVFDHQRTTDGRVQYKTERLLSFEEFKCSEHMDNHFYTGCKYLLDTCCALFWIHKAGFVHSNISPDHIKYSEASEVWKIIDFDQSMTIDDSASTPRQAGTPGFRHPEYDEFTQTGIFTPATDLYSLRSTYSHLFYANPNPNPNFKPESSASIILNKIAQPEQYEYSLFDIIADLFYIYIYNKPGPRSCINFTVDGATQVLITDKKYKKTVILRD